MPYLLGIRQAVGGQPACSPLLTEPPDEFAAVRRVPGMSKLETEFLI